MPFYTDKKHFSHEGRFYGIPLYLNLDGEILTVAGKNIIFDRIFSVMVFFHNTVVGFSAQTLSSLFNYPYEAGFPFVITGKIEK